MSDFHRLLSDLRIEIWEAGPHDSDGLRRIMTDLASAQCPDGVSRLPTARMAAGGHLEPQRGNAPDAGDPGPLEQRRRTRRRDD